MTSIKIHFRPSTIEGSDEGRLFIRLIHNRKQARIPTGYIIRTREWNRKEGQLILPEDTSERHGYLTEIQDKVNVITAGLLKSISECSLKGDYKVEDIVKQFTVPSHDDPFRKYCKWLESQLRDNGRFRTARAYCSAIQSFRNFTLDGITAQDFTSGRLKLYEEWMLDRGLKMNTVSFYMRNLRVIYNRAVSAGILTPIEDKPFRGVYTGIHATRHRALSEKQLNSLSALEAKLEGMLREKGDGRENIREYNFNLKLKKALDLFLFCFHARGMSFIDMAYLKKSDIATDTIVYKRKKTGRLLEVKVTAPMKRIIDRYQTATGDSPYVFPVIIPERGAVRSQYERGLNEQNYLLGVLSRMADIPDKVSTHVSRHTWASIAKRHKVDIAVISEALGHSSVRVTEIYLDSFDRSVLDSVSDKVSGVIKTGSKVA